MIHLKGWNPKKREIDKKEAAVKKEQGARLCWNEKGATALLYFSAWFLKSYSGLPTKKTPNEILTLFIQNFIHLKSSQNIHSKIYSFKV